MRLKSVITLLSTVASKHGALKRMSFVMNALTDELVEELETMDPAIMESYLAHIGLVIEWIGHGRNELLPPQLRAFAEMVMPSPVVEGESSEDSIDPQESGTVSDGAADAPSTTVKEIAS